MTTFFSGNWAALQRHNVFLRQEIVHKHRRSHVFFSGSILVGSSRDKICDFNVIIFIMVSVVETEPATDDVFEKKFPSHREAINELGFGIFDVIFFINTFFTLYWDF